MGAGVSDWRLARAVALAGQMGVVSGTALDTILIRRLQDGDADGAMRRALRAFPYPEMADRILSEWYIEGGKEPDASYRVKPLPEVAMNRLDEELLIVASFAEVYLAKEGHSGWIGINLLEKIQLPTLPSLFGAMLAGVDVVIMGGGIPLAIPGVLDEMAELRPVHLKLHVLGAERGHEHRIEFHPGTHVPASQEPLSRPCSFPWSLPRHSRRRWCARRAVTSTALLSSTTARAGTMRRRVAMELTRSAMIVRLRKSPPCLCPFGSPAAVLPRSA